MEERDYQTYLQLFRHMSNFMCRPNLIVYLDLTPETSLERIRSRNREVESGITLAYLEALRGNYESFIEDISRLVPVVRVNWEEFRDAETMAEVIEREYLGSTFVRDVSWGPATS